MDFSTEGTDQIERALNEDPYPDDMGEFMEDGAWKCIGCGACCNDVRWIIPHWTSKTSSACIKLEGTSCSIYKTRPLACRVKDYTASLGQKFSEFKAAAVCSTMRRLWTKPKLLKIS